MAAALTMNSFLSVADQNYAAGRGLWLSWMPVPAGNLLWLGFEQLAKLIILQRDWLAEASSGQPVDQLQRALDKRCRSIDSSHSLDPLLDGLRERGGVYLSEHRDSLEHLRTLFQRRYCRTGGLTTPLALLHDVDASYFAVRAQLDPSVQMALIDEIVFRKRIGAAQTLPAFESVHRKNKSFRGRKHPAYNVAGFGRIWTTDGLGVRPLTGGVGRTSESETGAGEV